VRFARKREVGKPRAEMVRIAFVSADTVCRFVIESRCRASLLNRAENENYLYREKHCQFSLLGCKCAWQRLSAIYRCVSSSDTLTEELQTRTTFS